MKKKAAKFVAVNKRQPVLNQRRNLKMTRSAETYIRGNTAKFYEWLDSANGLTLPRGPSIWVCGDCHAGNLGPVANAKGEIDIQIRDLDQTVIGNPAHDLLRLGLSLASSARGSDLPGVTTVRILEHMMKGYKQALAAFPESTTEGCPRPDAVKMAMKAALKRKWRNLARERIEDTSPKIPLGKRFWPLSHREQHEIEMLFGDERVRRLVTSLRSRDSDASVEVLDAAFWVKGCSSVGRLRYAVLLAIGGKEGELCLVDVKEAVQAVAPHDKTAKMPKDNAERVVAGAWHLSPALGDRMLAARLQGRAVFLRELLRRI